MAAVPDGEEHSLENFCRRAVDCDAVVLPVAVGGGDICVLVGEVDAARECDLAVDRDDFAVVADIQLVITDEKKGIKIVNGTLKRHRCRQAFCR